MFLIKPKYGVREVQKENADKEEVEWVLEQAAIE